MEELTLLATLVLLHLLGDFYLQPKSWVDERNRNRSQSVRLPLHAAIHGGLAAVAVLWFGGSPNGIVFVFMAISIGHLVTDLAKSYCPPELKWFVIDQLLHLVWIVFIWMQLSGVGLSGIVAALPTQLSDNALTIAICYALALKPASVFVSVMLNRWAADFADVTSTGDDTDSPTLAFAGEYIGYLERSLIVTFILCDQLSGIGFVLAAKSVFRFGDLKEKHDRKFTEYIMLGTFGSIAIAAFIGLMARLVIL